MIGFCSSLMVFPFVLASMIQRRSATRRWNWLARPRPRLLGGSKPNDGARADLFSGPCRMAAGVKFRRLFRKDRYEWLTHSTIAPAMSAPAKWRGSKMVGDVPDDSSTLGMQQFEDFRFVRTRSVSNICAGGACSASRTIASPSISDRMPAARAAFRASATLDSLLLHLKPLSLQHSRLARGFASAPSASVSSLVFNGLARTVESMPPFCDRPHRRPTVRMAGRREAVGRIDFRRWARTMRTVRTVAPRRFLAQSAWRRW